MQIIVHDCYTLSEQIVVQQGVLFDMNFIVLLMFSRINRSLIIKNW